MISKLTDLAKELVDKIKSGFKAIVDAIKAEIQKLRDWIAG